MAAKRLLLVDDEPDIREVARVSLETTTDWEIETAGSGVEALDRIKAGGIDAVLLDVMMPDMDGLAIFKRLRSMKATRDLPVILLTAKVQAMDQARFDEMGVAGVIAKPFDPLLLGDQIAEIVGWPTGTPY